MSLLKDVLLYAGGIIAPNAIGGASARFTSEAVRSDWYINLKKAPFSPPKWVFPIAWTSLYSLMGASSVMVYKASAGAQLTDEVKCALICYGTQLALNACWSTIFFKWKRLGAAVVWILLIDAAVIVTNYKFFAVDKVAGLLFLPYTGWCMFATLLSYSIWLLNYDNKPNTD